MRIVYIYTFFAAHRTLFNLYLSYPISWVITILAHAVCLFVFVRRKEFKKLAVLPPPLPVPAADTDAEELVIVPKAALPQQEEEEAPEKRAE